MSLGLLSLMKALQDRLLDSAYKIAHVDFQFGPEEYDPFFNVNRLRKSH